MNACKGYAAGRIWLQVALVEGKAGKGADKKPHGPGRMFVFQWGMTLGDCMGQSLAFEHRWAGKSCWSLFVPFWFFLHYPFYPLLSLPCFSPSPHSASFTFSTSLSLYRLSLGNSTFSLCAEWMSSPELLTDDSSQWELWDSIVCLCAGCWRAVAQRMCVFVVVQ